MCSVNRTDQSFAWRKDFWRKAVGDFTCYIPHKFCLYKDGCLHSLFDVRSQWRQATPTAVLEILYERGVNDDDN